MPRTATIFNNVDASASHTSQSFDFDKQDARFLIQLQGVGLNGAPRVIVEESVDGNLWTALEDTETWEEYFEPVNSVIMGIKDNYFMGQYMRLRIEPNNNTAGTIKAVMCYKTRV